MIKIKDFKEWKDCFNSHFYEKMGVYFKKFDDKDKRHNRIYFKLKVTPSSTTYIPTEISEFLSWYGYAIIDYDKGICRKGSIDIRIGKVFNDLGQDDLLRVYSESKQPLKNTENLSVVICRHRYDCMGMSTNRGWSTCIDLNDKKYNGRFLNVLRGYLTGGCLVAYLIRDNDRNINNPISRISITSSYNKLMDGKCYGTILPEFETFVRNWVRDYNKY